MLKPIAITCAIVLLAIPARAQELRSMDSGLNSKSDVRVQDAQKPAAAQDQDDDDDDDPTRGWNRMKRGFYTGLVLGGIVGLVMAIDCGDPECGPIVTAAAGVGAGIGLTIDLLLIPERPNSAATASRHDARARPFTAGRRVAVGFRTSW